MEEFNVGTSNSNESIEREQFLTEDEDRNLMNEFNVGTSNSNESIEREQFLTEDEDLNLMNEDINSCETEFRLDWMVAANQKKFQDGRNEEENEAILRSTGSENFKLRGCEAKASLW
ncbi:hypothetical protein RIF29_21799 [Crotalaria pallida]|uniref:Uncharacterized protein n=1 Tax=Crotalaria pallida TaxID=3830 RepID=A0AAN9F816_CROPI